LKNILLLLLIITQLFSLELPLENTAILLEKGSKEIGICHPFRLGRTDEIEFSTHPILGFIIPNFKIKGKISSVDNSTNSYFFKLTYPTPLLKLVQKEGIGGFIAPDPDFEPIPHIIISELGMISTQKIMDKYLMSLSGSLAFSAGLGTVDSRISIDLPYFFPRMNMYNSDYTLISGLYFTGPFWRKIGFDVGGTIRYTLGSEQEIAFEFMDKLFWQFKPNMKFMFGYNLYYAEYPFGNQWDMIPMIDLRYSW